MSLFDQPGVMYKMDSRSNQKDMVRYEWHGPDKGMYARVKVITPAFGPSQVRVKEIVSEKEYFLRTMKKPSRSKRVG